MRLAPLALCLLLLPVACDGTGPPAPPLDPPSVDASPGGGTCSEIEVEGAVAERFEVSGSCLRGRRDGPLPVLPDGGPRPADLLRGWAGALPRRAVRGAGGAPCPRNVRFAGHARGGTEVLDRRSDPAEHVTVVVYFGESLPGRKCHRGAEPEPEPLVYVREGGVTERWLRLEGPPRRSTSPPIVWSIGDSIMDGGRDDGRGGPSPTGASRSTPRWVDPSSSGVALATDAAEQDADAVVMELGTNDSSVGRVRRLTWSRRSTSSRATPFVIWQTAKGPEDGHEHPGGQRDDPRGRADLPERRDRRLGGVRARGSAAGGRDPSGRGLRAARSPSSCFPCSPSGETALASEGATSCGRKVVRETA